MSTNELRYLEQIARELHVMNKVLERMAQAPIFKKDTNDDYLERFNLYFGSESPQEKQSL